MKEDPSHRLLLEHDRWKRFFWPLILLVVGWSAQLVIGWWWHPSWERVAHRGALASWWLAGVGVTFLGAVCVGLICRRSLLRSARSLDVKLAAKNRIETAAALQNDSGALARAQREETAGFLQQTPGRPRRRLLAGLGLLLLFLLFAHLVTILSWTRPWISAPASAKPLPVADLPKASIRWKSPMAETKAVPVEEVPLEAVADSTSGLRDMVLDVSINGGPGRSVPMALEDLGKPGKRLIETSIYLDQLEVEPFDVIAYHLRARRIDARQLPETVSPVQFVQVKPFRDDVREVPGGDGLSEFPLILALKSAQLRLIKENFLLAHTELSHESAEWKKQNTRVASEQGLLEEKTGEVIQKLVKKGIPAEIINLLSQAKPMMVEAQGKVLASENRPALAAQGKALGFLTEVEKFFVKCVARDGSVHGPKGLEDPFRDKKLLELKQRFKTAAGELELLAKEQNRLANDLSKNAPPAPPSFESKPDKIEGSPAERQTQISQRIGALLNSQVFVAEVVTHLEQGRGKAMESLQHLDAEDPAAAQEPAAEAARELRLALIAMYRAAEDDANDQLANALRELNRAADAAQSAPHQDSDVAAHQKAEEASKAAAEAGRKAAEAAQKQQETGSEKAASRLNELAKALSSDDVQKRLEQFRQQPRDADLAKNVADRLHELADRAAQPDEKNLSRDQVARLVEKLERTHANMKRLAKGDKGEGDKGEGDKGEGDKGEGDKGEGDKGEGDKGEGDKGEGDKGEGDKGEGDKGEGTTGEGTTGEGTTGEGTTGEGGQSGGERRERFAQELLEDLEGGLREASLVLPKAEEFLPLREWVRPTGPRKAFAAIVADFSKIDPPLAGVIHRLRAELAVRQRQHLLTDQEAEQAPAGYREAVADYFEQLSRDYASEPTATPEEPK